MKLLASICILAVVFGSGSLVFAAGDCDDGSCDSKCGHAITGVPGHGAIDIVTSGRDPDGDEAIRQAAFRVAEVAHDLGYHVPPHQMILAPSRALSMMVPVGGYAAPHWRDGQQIVQNGPSMSGVMEFVVDGCPTCRSFYRDTTEFKEQVSIIAHVAGHNDVGKASAFQASRNSDPVASKLELAHLMQKLYSIYDKDEVSLFYQFLESLDRIQDYSHGSYSSPEELRNKSVSTDDLQRVTAPRKGEDRQAVYAPKKWPLYTTPSALQAYVSNMPANSPEWKRDMARLYEKSQNMYPTVVQQKILNEGWATFSQYLIAKHLDGYNADVDLLAYAGLLGGVAYPQLSNPYWLGLEGWLNLYKNFNARADVKAMSDEKEKDRLFVKEAHSHMATLDDYAFIRMALDEQWIKDHKLLLKRRANYEDLEARGINPWAQNPPQEYDIILSINSERIIDAIARRQGEKRSYFPRIMLANMNHLGKEVLYVHQPFEGTPLERFSATQALYVLAHMNDKPVSLDTIASSLWVKGTIGLDAKVEEMAHGDEEPDYGNPDDIDDFMVGGWFPPMPWIPPQHKESPIRISVFPDGTVKVYERPNRDGPSGAYYRELRKMIDAGGGPGAADSIRDEEYLELNAELTAQLQGAVDYYKNDLSLTVNSNLAKQVNDYQSDHDRENWFTKVNKDWVNRAASTVSKPHDGLVTHAPTAPDAILDFERMLRSRLPGAIEAAMNGEGAFKTGSKGVKVRALPIVPEFQHDMVIMRKIDGAKPDAPMDDPIVGMTKSDIGVDDSSDLGTGVGLPGDLLPVPAKGEGEGDEGEGEGDPQDGQPEDGDPSDQEPEDIIDGDGSNDPSVVDIPMDLWTELLNQYLELPNPRKTKGGMQTKDEERAGVRTREGEPVVWDETMDEALRWGLAQNPEALKPIPGETGIERSKRIRALFAEGLKVMPPEQYRIRAWQETTEPEFKAVVVFVLDLSGSMQGLPLQKSKEFIFNVTAFLKSHYKDVEIRYVGYDTTAYEFTEDEVFSTEMGGSTDDTVGYIKANEILEEYNSKNYNKYVYGTADGGGFKVDELVEVLEETYKEVQHMGFVENQLGWTASQDMLDAIQALSKKHGWFDYAVIDDERNSIIKALNEFFGPGKNDQRSGQ